jgi:hypothetical protein
MLSTKPALDSAMGKLTVLEAKVSEKVIEP